MNRDEIMNMQPGPGINAFIHKTLFGITVRPVWAPLYSTDISAAWEIETELQRKGLADDYGFELFTLTDAYEVSFEGNNINVFKIAHASPLERCKAALLSLIQEDTP